VKLLQLFAVSLSDLFRRMDDLSFRFHPGGLSKLWNGMRLRDVLVMLAVSLSLAAVLTLYLVIMMP
jgi:hypothetical protein